LQPGYVERTEEVGQGEGVGRVRQVLWNERVGQLGAEGVGVTVRYLDRGEGVESEAVLTWKGEVWEPVGEGVTEGEALK